MSCNQFDFSCRNCLSVTVGFDYNVQFTYTDYTGDPIDLTSLGLFMDFKDTAAGAYVLRLQKTTDLLTSGLYTPNPTSGEFSIYITAAETVTLGEGGRLYELYASTDLLPDYSNFSTASKDLISYGNISFVEGAFDV